MSTRHHQGCPFKFILSHKLQQIRLFLEESQLDKKKNENNKNNHKTQVMDSLLLHFNTFYMTVSFVLFFCQLIFQLSFLFCFSNDDVRKNVDNAIGEV